MNDNQTPPQSVPSDADLVKLANMFGYYDARVHSILREVRDRTQAANQQTVNELGITIRHELFAALEAELKYVRAKLQQYDVEDFCDLSYEVDKRVKEAEIKVRAKTLREAADKIENTTNYRNSWAALRITEELRRAAEEADKETTK